MKYFDRDEIESALEVLEDIKERLESARSEADEYGITIGVSDYALDMRILDLREALARLDEAEERAMNRAYERSVLYV